MSSAATGRPTPESPDFAHRCANRCVVHGDPARRGAGGQPARRPTFAPWAPTARSGGAAHSGTISASAIGNPWGFTGRQYDSEVGLYHYRARAYSPELRRFIQRDPLEYVDGPNAYTYVSGGPVRFVDPLGLDDKELAEAIE